MCSERVKLPYVNKMVTRRMANWILAILFALFAVIGIAFIVFLSSADSKAQPIVFNVGTLYGDCEEKPSGDDYALNCTRLGLMPPADTPMVEASALTWIYEGVRYDRCEILLPETGMDSVRLVCPRI